jgi:chorismate mutase
MRFRGVRGAITVDANAEAAILDSTQELLQQMVKANEVDPDDIAGVLFTVTGDLDATFPAEAARRLPRWTQVPLMCAQEVPVPGALPRCVRVLMLVNTTKTADEVHHIYLRAAERLRPDLTPSRPRSLPPTPAEHGR